MYCITGRFWRLPEILHHSFTVSTRVWCTIMPPWAALFVLKGVGEGQGLSERRLKTNSTAVEGIRAGSKDMFKVRADNSSARDLWLGSVLLLAATTPSTVPTVYQDGAGVQLVFAWIGFAFLQLWPI